MRLFVSYARVDKPYCIQIVDTLSAHDVWFDERLYVGQQWWKEILRRLDWCEGFVYLLSPDSLASEYCRREYELALSLNKHIFPVRIQKEMDIPESLVHVQYADFSNGLTPEATRDLLNSILFAERQRVGGYSSITTSAIPLEETRPPSVNPSSVISVVSQSMENGQYDKAVFILRQAKASGYTSRFINIDTILREAETGLERQSWLREADREYRQIADLVRHKRTRDLGKEAFLAFQKDYPDYDPDGLAALCGDITPSGIGVLPERIISSSSVPTPNFTLPMLEWVEIPAGMAMVEDSQIEGQSVRQQIFVDTFKVAKYPVTNAQFQRFIDDPMGYNNLSWWQFSPQANEWRIANPTPKPARFKGDERPRENVTWYEAMAFCHWLSTRLGYKVTLPTEAQWQRAAQGEDQRRFPWGDSFDASKCNARESEVKSTTMVMRYPEGASPYGVYDMVGNVWEWCLDTKAQHELNVDISGAEERAVHGGSFVSVHERSEISFHYFLSPATSYASIGFRIIQNI
jgi:formylglycine-generating enzyme required for sulfatase activity